MSKMTLFGFELGVVKNDEKAVNFIEIVWFSLNVNAW